MWLRRAVDAGDTAAMSDLGRILAQRGRLDEAEMWLRRAVDAGETGAMSELAHVLLTQGRKDEAKMWQRRAASISSPRTDVGVVVSDIRTQESTS